MRLSIRKLGLEEANLKMKLLYLLVIVLIQKASGAAEERHTNGSPYRVEEIRSKILQELGMRRAPNITNEDRHRAQTLREANRLLQMYNEENDDEEQEEADEEFRLYARKFNVYDAECGQNHKPVPRMVYPLYFTIPSKPAFGARVLHAWLKVHLQQKKDCDQKKGLMTMKVYSGMERGEGWMRRITESQISVVEGGWVQLNISSFLHEKLNSGNSSSEVVLGLTLENNRGELENPYPVFGRFNCRNGIMEPERTLSNDDVTPSIETSVIEIPLLTGRQKRSLRSNRQRCKRVPVYLSFSDIGWNNWVLQPQGFETGFCSGSCGKVGWRIDLGRNRTEGFSQRVRSMYECCAPSKMKSVKIVHFDDTRKLSLSVLENFLVTQCGCATGTS